jgi:hypothetical protein
MGEGPGICQVRGAEYLVICLILFSYTSSDSSILIYLRAPHRHGFMIIDMVSPIFYF